jgi:hypothetical protein
MTTKRSKIFFCVSIGARLTHHIDLPRQGESIACLDGAGQCGTLVTAIAASDTIAYRLGAVIKRIGLETGSPSMCAN